MAFAALALWEVFLICAFIIALAIGTSWDRNGRTSAKWLIVFAGAIGYCVWGLATGAQPSPVTSEFWTNSKMWHYVGRYLLIGWAYIFVEAIVDILSARRHAAFRWEMFVNGGDDALKKYLSHDPDRETSLDDHYYYKTTGAARQLRMPSSVLDFPLNTSTRRPQPTINKQRLVENSFAWLFLWPAYLLSLLFGKVLDYVFETATEYLGAALQRFTSALFRNTFK